MYFPLGRDIIDMDVCRDEGRYPGVLRVVDTVRRKLSDSLHKLWAWQHPLLGNYLRSSIPENRSVGKMCHLEGSCAQT